MCIAVFIWQDHPIYPFLLLLNRDEYHTRPTKPLTWWEGGGHILGGRDGLAGGTWLACTRDGRVAFLTNVRELQSLPQPKSRGHLPVRFLESKKDPYKFAEELVKEADQYNGFNLIIANLCSMTMVYVTNRPKEGNGSIMEVSPGIHVLSNARLDSPWPKSERLRHSFKELLDLYGDAEVAVAEMVEKLMRDTIRDDESVLPHIYPAEKEYYLSSIFVEAETPLGRYGTRSSSALSFTTSGELSFHETSLQEEGWEEQTVTYQIEKINK
ncbi:hypothetical protein RHGRI_032982 [Rhododendron griersonianum]|uniref:Uncharacterized protein n=1 Tax=Rhododendron griersonianum TaxID=479676 RepID=A0AAV6IJM1_9ERIC|nr:hypothetical protein RHGRI_032982 [Rhododendron griersonianum]